MFVREYAKFSSRKCILMKFVSGDFSVLCSKFAETDSLAVIGSPVWCFSTLLQHEVDAFLSELLIFTS
jgi:hypothetical protein